MGASDPMGNLSPAGEGPGYTPMAANQLYDSPSPLSSCGPSGHSYCYLPHERMEEFDPQDCKNTLTSREGQVGIFRIRVEHEVPCHGTGDWAALLLAPNPSLLRVTNGAS